MNLDPKQLRRLVYWDLKAEAFVCAAYFELPTERLVMSITLHKQKAMAVNLAMKKARERTLAGDFEPVWDGKP